MLKSGKVFYKMKNKEAMIKLKIESFTYIIIKYRQQWNDNLLLTN